METSQGRGRNRIGRRDVEAGEGDSGFNVDRQGRPPLPRGAARDGARGSGRCLLAPLGRFLRDTRAGATAITAAALVMMTLGGSALIVDHLWLVGQRDALKSAADAAAVAATLELLELPSDMSEGEIEAALQPTAERYVRFNVSGNLPADARRRMEETLEVSLMVDRAAGVVDVAARADLGGTLLSALLLDYAGPEDGIVVEAGVGAEVNPIEVVLAIDISGSMRRDLEGNWARNSPDNRINTVKRAAADLVAILNPDESRRVAIGMVPWHHSVRLEGSTREEWERKGWAKYPESRRYAKPYRCTPAPECLSRGENQYLPFQDGTTWNGCLDEHRVSGGGHADFASVESALDLPAYAPFAQAFYPAVYGFAYQCLAPPLPDGYSRQFCYDDTSVHPGHAQQSRRIQYGCEREPPPILPLTSERSAIESAIERLEANTGETHSALGVLWGQRLLSRSWKSVWGGAVHPVDPDEEGNAEVRKAIVLLTDGADTQCMEPGDPACETGGGVPRGDACALAKAEGTEIFVIAAMPPREVTGALGRSLRECSSEGDDPAGTYVFLNNATPESLEAAFADIGRQITSLRRTH